MQLLRTVVDIHEQQIIKQQILEKIIFVKVFLVSDYQILYLAHCHLANHIGICASTLCNQHIEHFAIFQNFEHVDTAHNLTVSRGVYEIPHQLVRYIPVVEGGCHCNSFHINYTQINPCDRL